MINRLAASVTLVAVFALPCASTAADKVPIRVGIDVGVNSLPFWIGMEKGFFAENGLKVSAKTYDSGFLGLLAIGAGEGDTSSQSDTPTLTLMGKGIDAPIVAVMARSADNYKIVGKNNIINPAGLKGKKFGMTLGSACEYVGLNYLAKNGLGRHDVEVVGAAPSELAPLLAKGDIDAACFWEPWGRKTIALTPSNLHVIGTGRDIYAVNMYLTVRREFAAKHPEAVKGLLKGLQKANTYIANNQSEAAQIIEKKHRVDTKMAAELSKDFDYVLLLDDEVLTTMKQVGQWLVDNKKLNALPDRHKLIDASYLREIAPGAVSITP
jgi:ABC-type nitrate/sulfonate/bicarbonate transport system substrate-binding protein